MKMNVTCLHSAINDGGGVMVKDVEQRARSTQVTSE